MTEFPTMLEALPEIQTLIDGLSGKEQVDTHCLVKAGWVVGGFALSQVFKHPQPVGLSADGLSDADKIDLLKSAQKYLQAETDATMPVTAVSAFPWALLVDLAYQLVKEWLKK